MQRPDTPNSALRIWLTAVRPFAYTASVLTVALGAAMAHHAGYSLCWGCLAKELLARGYRVRVLVSAAAPGEAERWPAFLAGGVSSFDRLLAPYGSTLTSPA